MAAIRESTLANGKRLRQFGPLKRSPALAPRPRAPPDLAAASPSPGPPARLDPQPLADTYPPGFGRGRQPLALPVTASAGLILPFAWDPDTTAGERKQSTAPAGPHAPSIGASTRAAQRPRHARGLGGRLAIALGRVATSAGELSSERSSGCLPGSSRPPRSKARAWSRRSRRGSPL